MAESLTQIIGQVPLFAELPPEALAAIAASMRRRALGPAELLFAEGESGAELFIVVAGEVEVRRAVATPDERIIGRRGPGEFIGELSLLGVDSRRSATVYAVGEVQLLEMGRTELHALLAQHATLGATMLRVLGERLTAAHTGAIRDLHERNERLSRAYAELQAAQAGLIEKERLERELQVAYEIQMSILPRRMPALPGYSFGARVLPARSVGGDFFDLIPLAAGAVGIAIGDVTDKGVPAAIFMAQARALLRAEASRAATPREALERVNAHLLQMNEAGLFVTMLYGVLDGVGGVFRYARAGHELPILRLAGGETIVAPRGHGLALGLVETPPIDEQALAMASGDVLLLYTDGATEAHDPAYVEFGLERLRAALAASPAAPAAALCDQLVDAVLSFQGAAHQHDDITMVVVRREL